MSVVASHGGDSTRMHRYVSEEAVRPGDSRLTVWIDERSLQVRDAVTLRGARLQVAYR